MDDRLKAKVLAPARQVGRSFRAILLPVCLAILLVIQNVAFNAWLKISPQTYHQMYAATFALGVLLYGPSVFLRSHWRSVYLIVISSLISILLLSEYCFYSYSKGFLQISALKLTGQSSAVMGTALTFLTPKLVLFFGNILLVVMVGLYARRQKLVPVALTLGEKLLTVGLIVGSVFGGYHTLLAAERRDFGNSSRLYSQMYDLNSVVGKMGVVNYFLEDAIKRAIESGKVTDEDVAFVKQWASARPASVGRDRTFGMVKGRNLIFIQVESLEQAVMNAKMDKADITPNLNALAREGLSFSNYYTQVGMGNTADAEFSTLNSLYPLPDSVAFVDRAQNAYTALPQQLVDHGYHTSIFHGDVPTFWNRANIYPNLGYQTWFMQDAFTSTRDIGITGLGDEDFFQQSVPKLEALPQPFMATLITLSSHTPFMLPEDLQTLSIPSDSGLTDTQAQYLQSVHYTDKVLGDFIHALKQSKIYNNSVIVIFGDHGSYTGIGEALGEKSPENARVPLIILVPGTGLIEGLTYSPPPRHSRAGGNPAERRVAQINGGLVTGSGLALDSLFQGNDGEEKIVSAPGLVGERTEPGSHIDLYPTVMNLLGLDAPRSVVGQDLLNTKTPVAVLRMSGTGGIREILGADRTYRASEDGEFEQGSCTDDVSDKPLEITDCRALFDQQSAVLRVSDTAVRGNLIEAIK